MSSSFTVKEFNSLTVMGTHIYIYIYTERDAVEGAFCGGPKMLDLEKYTIITHKFLYRRHRRPELDSIESKRLGPRVSP